MSCLKWSLGDLSNGEPHHTPMKVLQEYSGTSHKTCGQDECMEISYSFAQQVFINHS